jgi:RNA polymerase sigma factor (TIGR02999 family)
VATRPGDQVTQILERARAGDPEAAEAAMRLLFDELRAIAAERMGRAGKAHTLQPTALVNEAYLRLVRSTQPWESRAHFLAFAARAMRSVLVDHERRKRALRRGGDRRREVFDEAVAWFETHQLDLLALDEALGRLATVNPRAAQVVELKYFGGLPHDRVARVLGISERSVERTWALARGWLHRALSGESGPVHGA